MAKKFNPFKHYMGRVKARQKRATAKIKPGSNLSETYLKKLWKDQNGVCKESGHSLRLPNSQVEVDRSAKDGIALLTKINKQEGYVKGNVHFTCVSNKIYSPFRVFINRAKWSHKLKNRFNYEPDIDLKYLKKIWDEQDGVCPLTGWSMYLPLSPEDDKCKVVPVSASLDRIDNNIGYMRGNVRWVSVMANLARHQHTDSMLLEFCTAVVNNMSNKESVSLKKGELNWKSGRIEDLPPKQWLRTP